MRRTIILVITVLSLTFGSVACSYDRVTDAPVTTVKKQLLKIPSNVNKGKWIYDSLEDEGGAVVYIIGASQNDVHALYIRCDWTSEDDKVEVFWHFRNSLAFGPSINVTYGFQGVFAERIKEKWLESYPENKAVFAPFPIQFARYIKDNHDDILSITYVDGYYNTATARFDVTGADVAVQWVLDNCGYIWE